MRAELGHANKSRWAEIATYGDIYDKLSAVEFYLLHAQSPSKNKTYLPEF